MKHLSIILGFAAGFIVATVIGLFVVMPGSRDAYQINIDSDVHRPLQAALESIERAAAHGDCEKAAAQLRLLNKRFAEYRAGGPMPANWWNEVAATTLPADAETTK